MRLATRQHPGVKPGYRSCDPRQLWVIYHEPVHGRWRRCGTVTIAIECCICDHREFTTVPVPRLRLLPIGEHPGPRQFLLKHRHPERRHPRTWSRPVEADTGVMRMLNLTELEVG